ncbi:MAG: hypothetical protein JJU26_11705, partial [Oceanicaulis sp.]|nr:hypothetical protein [Oceanicaulis sp.]
MIGLGKRMRAQSAKRQEETIAAPDWREAAIEDPAIILGDPALMNALLGSPEGMSDIGAKAREGLQREIRRLKAANDTLITIARNNLAAQARAHSAVLKIIDTPTLAALDRELAGPVASALGVEAVRVCLEGQTPLPRPMAILPAAPGLKAALLGEASDRMGAPDPRFAPALYGPQAARIASEAVIALEGKGFA